MNLIKILQNKLQESPDETNIDVKITRYLLNHINDPKLSVGQIATDNYASKATISRFFKELGYNSFRDFQIEHENFLAIDRQEVLVDFQSSTVRDVTKEGEFIRHNFDLILQDLQQFRDELELSDLAYLADKIKTKERIYLYATGIPGEMASILQYHFLTVGKLVEYYPIISDQIESASQLQETDLAIFISLEGSHVMTKELTLSVTNSMAESVLLTQNPTMKFSANFKKVICLGSHSHPQSGKYKLLFFIETLLHHYFVKYL